jgi:lipoprotein-releasing system permease protein
MIRICFLGIFIGTFALMLTLIITNGFEKVIHEKMQGITSQAIIHAPGKQLEEKSIKTVLKTEFSKDVVAFSSSSIRQVIIDHNKRQSVLFLKGVEPETEGKVSTIAEKITYPRQGNLRELLQNNQIIIGYKTARMYNLAKGSVITFLIPEPGGKRKIFLKKKKVTIGGIFKVGLDEYDSNFAYCSLKFLKSVFKDDKGVDQISLALSEKNDSEAAIIEKLRKRLAGLTVNSWKDLYPALVESLKLEKYVMFFILALITLVACMNMISLLFMQIEQKKRDIAIFKAMGMAHKNIKRIFLTIGLSITFFASILGLGLAAGVGYFLERYPFIKIPDVYYVSYLPARMEIEIFFVVFVCTMLIGLFATWFPAQRTKKIKIVDVLRQE